MTMFRVTWEIDVEANTPDEAAQAAFDTMQRQETTATCFSVRAEGSDLPHYVDLGEVCDGE